MRVDDLADAGSAFRAYIGPLMAPECRQAIHVGLLGCFQDWEKQTFTHGSLRTTKGELPRNKIHFIHQRSRSRGVAQKHKRLNLIPGSAFKQYTAEFFVR